MVQGFDSYRQEQEAFSVAVVEVVFVDEIWGGDEQSIAKGKRGSEELVLSWQTRGWQFFSL